MTSVLRETASQTAGPYVHIGLAPNQAGFGQLQKLAEGLSSTSQALSSGGTSAAGWNTRPSAGRFRLSRDDVRMPPAIIGGILGVDLAAAGLPDEAAYVAAYCRRTGRAGLPALDYYVAFNMFRFAAILHGIRGRIIRGTAASAEASALSSHFEQMAELAWQQAMKTAPQA